MLSAVANFLFGAEPERPAAERTDTAEVDYDLKEADDWLLVDVSDQEEVDFDKVEDAHDEEEDDILTSVPFFLSSMASSERMFDPSMTVTTYPRCEESWFVTPSSCLISELPEEKFVEVMPEEEHIAEKPLALSTSRPSLFLGFIQNVTNISFSMISFTDSTMAIVARSNYNRRSNEVKKTSRTKTTAPYSRKTKHEREDKRIHHPANLSGAFINHQSPLVVSKTELLEQIKELKPIQQAREYEQKKYLKKSFMDRQNKAYHFEASNKNRRRKDVWQRHSGANNNRKCC